MRTWLIVLCLLVLASCASKPSKETTKSITESISYTSNGAVRAEIVDAPETVRYQVKPGITYVNPEPAALNELPTYPPSLLVKQLDPVEVIVRVIVNAAGSVESATITRNSSEEQAFADATVTAVKGWIYTPLKRVEGSSAEALPFSQEYRFTFKQVDGRAVVSSGGSR